MRSLEDWAFAAARTGCVAVLARMLDQGVSPDSINDDGDTLLVAAIRRRQANCLQMLLSRGANPDLPVNEACPLEIASYVPRNAQCIRSLILHGADLMAHQDAHDGRSYLTHCASEASHATNLEEFLKHLPSADIRNEDDESLLTYAIVWGNAEGVRVLLNAGLDVNARVCRGETPLLVATGAHCPTTNEIINVLLDHGADPNIAATGESPCAANATPLIGYVACQAPSEENLIVARRIALMTRNINYRTPGGKSALSFARDVGYIPYVKLLVELGATDQ